jgi:hypothetical protein
MPSRAILKGSMPGEGPTQNVGLAGMIEASLSPSCRISRQIARMKL